MTNSASLVRLDEVAVAFGATTALADVTVELRAGEVLSLIGPNGSGKTTLLHTIAGVVRPTSGTVSVDPAAAPVAYVLQRREEHPWMPLTAAEVIRMGRYRGRPLGRLGRSDHRVLDEVAERLEVTGLLGRQYGVLSGGQRQRVLVAQALAQEPGVLLLDEPVTGLDMASQQRILALVAEESARGTVVVMSTHHLHEAAQADRVLLLDHRPVALGPPSETLTTANLEQAFAGRVLALPGSGSAPRIVLDDHGHGTHH